MSELLRIDDVKADAEFAARMGLDVNANPYRKEDDPRRHHAWLSFYYGDAAANSHESHFSACC